jgi:hypothetical protein
VAWVARTIALMTLCVAALIATSHDIHAASVTLGGSPLAIGPNPLYGSGSSLNNVVNSPGAPPTNSILVDPTGPYLTSSTPWVQNGQVVVSTCATCFAVVQWFFTGSESGFDITFNAPGLANFTEGNQNNSAYGGGASLGLVGGQVQYLGTTIVQANGPKAIPFSLTWLNGSVDNNSTQPSPASGLANIIFSYVDTSTIQTIGSLTLTKTQFDGFAFALNDNGGRDNDNDHDDFVGFAFVSVVAPALTSTPIPSALSLFVTVLGCGFLLRKWRNRRNNYSPAGNTQTF